MTEDLKEYLNEQAAYLEKQRIKGVRLNLVYKVMTFLKAIAQVATIVLGLINVVFPLLIPALIITLVVWILLSLMKNPRVVFEQKLKNAVLPTVFEKVNPTFKYAPHGYGEQALKGSEFLNKGFFANTIDIRGEDHVTGRIENIEVEFFEVTFIKEVVNYGKTAAGCLLGIVLLPIIIIRGLFDGDGNEDDDLPFDVVRDVKVFLSGFFMKADFHKDFKGKVLMIPKSQDGIRDKMYEMFKPKSLDLMTIENPYINDRYNIYTSDNQLGYYVLSQTLIDRIHEIADKEKALPTISFINGVMYFLIPWDKNLFSVNLKIPIKDASYFLPYLVEVDSFKKIVKDLNLDTRIWSKV